jgi:hypothetical protein
MTLHAVTALREVRQVRAFRCHWAFSITNNGIYFIFLWGGMKHFFLWRYSPHLGLGLPPWNSPFHFGLLDLRHSVGLLGRVISSSQGICLYTNTEKRTPNIHALSEIRTHDPDFRASEDSICGVKLSPLNRTATSGPNVPAPDDDGGGGGAVDKMRIGRINWENFPQATLSTTNSTWYNWGRTRSEAVGSRELTTRGRPRNSSSG